MPKSRSGHLSVLLLILLLVTNCAVGQTPSTTVVIPRDTSSVALLTRTISAMGGSTSASATTGFITKGNLTVSPGGVSGQVTWENAGAEFRYEQPGPNGQIVFVSGHGNPAILDSGKVQRKIGHLAMTNLAPHLAAISLVNSLNSTATEISSPQQVTISGLTAIKISFVDHTDELSSVICKQDWFFDQNSLLPLRVDFLTSEMYNALNTVKMSYLFSNYQNVSGVLIPFTVITLFDGQQVSQLDITSVQVGASIPTTDFDVTTATSAGAL